MLIINKIYLKTILFAILLILLINIVSAIDFSIDFPSTVDLNEEFSVNIIVNSTTNVNGTHDVKIVVQDQSTIISEIYEDGWKNPYYYLKAVYPEQKDFKNHVIKSPGTRELCVRLRQTGKTAYKELCKSIIVTGSESSLPENSGKADEADKTDKTENSNDTTSNSISDNTFVDNLNNQNQPTEQSSNDDSKLVTTSQDILSQQNTEQAKQDLSQETQPILLNPQNTIKTNSNVNNDIYISNEYQRNRLISFTLTGICLILVIVLFLRERKLTREEV